MLYQAGPCILGVKLESRGVTGCAACHPPVPLCQGRAVAALPRFAFPWLTRGTVGGRAGGDITSNGPECGNSVNKVYFTFNFGI